MGPRVEALRSLQDIEFQIVDIKQQVRRRERAVATQQRKLDELRREIANEREVVRRAQVEMDQTDLELKSHTARVDEMRNHLNQARTNKEYAAILAELNNEKADVTKLEARVLEMMQAVEQQQGALAERDKQESNEVERLKALEAQMAQTQQSFSDKLGQLEAARKAAIEPIDADALRLFDRLSERYDGEAMAEIERTHPSRDEFICNGCFMSLTPEVANAALTRDAPVTCPNCGRILWMMK